MASVKSLLRAGKAAVGRNSDRLGRKLAGNAPVNASMGGNPVAMLGEARRTLDAAYSSASPQGRKLLQRFVDDPNALLELPDEVLARLARGDVSAVAAASQFKSLPGRTAGQWKVPDGSLYSPEAVQLGVGSAVAAGVGALAGGGIASSPESRPEDLSDGLAGAPQEDIAPEPVAGQPASQPQPAAEQPSDQPAPTNWDRFGNPVFNEDPTPEPEGGWQPRPAGAGFGNYAAGMDQQLGNVQQRTLKILIDAGVDPNRAAGIVRGQLSMSEMERQAVIDNTGLQQQRAQSGITARRNARMGTPPPTSVQPGDDADMSAASGVDLGDYNTGRQGRDETDEEYRFRMGTGMDSNRRELDMIRNGGVPPSFDPGRLGDDERLPGVSSARPQSYDNPNTFDPMAQADPRQAFRDFERSEDLRRRGMGIPVEAQRERDFASGQYDDFDGRLEAQSRWAREVQFDPSGDVGPNDFQRRYNPQATAEWNDRMSEKVRSQAREDLQASRERQDADREKSIGSSQWRGSADNLFDAKAERADLERRVKNYARQNSLSYDAALKELQSEPGSPFLALGQSLPGDKYSNLERRSGQQRRLAAQVDRRDEQALRRERIATAGLLGISQPQANAFLMLSPEDRNRAVNYITNPMAAKIDLARASNEKTGPQQSS